MAHQMEEDRELEEQIEQIQIESEESKSLKEENRRLFNKITLLEYQLAKLK